jgi:hypothetical protein
MAAAFTMRGSRDFQYRNCDKLLLLYAGLLSPTTCTHNLEVAKDVPDKFLALA